MAQPFATAADCSESHMRRIVASLSALALALLGLIAVAGSSSAQDGPQITTGGLPDAGQIVLRTSWRGGFVEFTDAAGSTSRTGSFGRGCVDALDVGAIVVTGETGSACFGAAGLGDGPGRNGAPFYLNPNTQGMEEELTVSLAEPASDALISSMSLDIEASGTGEGTDLVIRAGEEQIDVDLENCGEGCGPLPGIPYPNYRVEVDLPSPAKEVTFSAEGSTVFQLEGDTNRIGSKFFLKGGNVVLPCNSEAPVESNGATLSLQQGDGCTEEPVFFQYENNEVVLLKEPSNNEFTLTVPWVDADADAAYPGRTTEINYFDDEEANYNPMVFCDVSGESPALPGDQIPGEPVDGWCIADREIPFRNVDGTFTTVETLYGKGDPRMR